MPEFLKAHSLTQLFLPQIELINQVSIILDHLLTPDLHGRSQLPSLNREFVIEDAKTSNLLERRKLFVDALYRAIYLVRDDGRFSDIRWSTSLELFHTL